MNESEYWAEVRSLAENIVEEAADQDLNEEEKEQYLWETIDGHEWIIYTAYHYDIMKHSPNDGYSAENFGAESIIKDGTLNTAAIAFGALYADVSERLVETD